MTEQELNAKIRVAFDKAVAANKEEDQVKLVMISAGATFKNVTRLFNEFMVDAGLAVSKEEKDAKVAEVMTKHEVATEAGFDAAVAELVEALKATDKSAAALIRSHGKKEEIEVFKKAGSAGRKSVDINVQVCEYLLENEYNEEAVLEFIKSQKENISEGAIATYMRHAKRTAEYMVKYHEAKLQA